tara:strand:+ start:251 stop:1249 length:999 start_codon:yes stop_codon:yes gene_type:complete
MSKPVAFIDLFAGMGGFTTGAIDAGAVCIVSVDSWGESNRVHKANHPHAPILNIELGHPSHWHIFKRMVDEWGRMGYHVHIHGSPPCQALSNASSRDPEEGMGLVRWFLDLVDKCEPDSWSMENVVPVRKRLPEGAPSVVLNSADFGVPQTRRRCYAGEGWIAEPTHTKEEWVSVIEALPHLTELLEDIKRAMMLNTVGGGSSIGRRVASAEKPVDCPSLTINNNPPSIRTVRLEALGANAKRHQDRAIDEPSKTICGSGNQAGARVFDHNENPPKKIRSLNTSETLVLQGFPADYDLSAATTQKARWTMVGNAVPPPVAAAVIRGIQNGIQ